MYKARSVAIPQPGRMGKAYYHADRSAVDNPDSLKLYPARERVGQLTEPVKKERSGILRADHRQAREVCS